MQPGICVTAAPHYALPEGLHVHPQHDSANVGAGAKLKLKASQQGDREHRSRTSHSTGEESGCHRTEGHSQGGGSDLGVVVVQGRIKPCFSYLQLWV